MDEGEDEHYDHNDEEDESGLKFCGAAGFYVELKRGVKLPAI